MKNEIHNKSNENPIAFVGIDKAICFYKNNRIYENDAINYYNIGKINKLYNSRWTIVYWIDRLSYLRELILFQLNNWGACFHELKIGNEKLFYDFVIDDKAKIIEEL